MNNPTKIANIAANINSRSLDIVLLQEATPTTATDLKATLGSDWEVATPLAGLPAQQVLFRTSKYTWNSTTNVGQAIDGTATTPIPTPAVRLDPIPPVDPPATGDPISQSILVVSVHFEDRWKYFPDATSEERRADAKANAQALISNITNANPDNLPVIVGGDFIGKPVDKQGNVSYCDESTPGCVGEGQPTFIRAGYWDSQNAQTKIGLQYGTVIGHTQLRTTTFGFAGRADFIVMKGIKGSKTYENMPKFSTSNTEQSDHAMIRTDIFVPKVPAP
ncbi:hypothetical protein ABIE44_003101 [Marmoricola sp. OAE513]|uniref:endonuclease/exonuclease/phosphatase family protein n=1 Tax=Marmoricola sp. OAE513 TaxID=2817894 RepID=UPI00339192B5